MYELLESKEVSEIKVVDLIRRAGVSRGGFYKNFYLVTDVLKDDIKAVSDDVGKAIGTDIGSNWEMILKTVYSHRKKIPLLIKSGMGSSSIASCIGTGKAIKRPSKNLPGRWPGSPKLFSM